MTHLKLAQRNDIPEGFLGCKAADLHNIFSAPTLIHLSGRQKKPLFVSMLLHGNEVTGLETIQAILKKYQGRTLPRSLSIFTGNIAAAKAGMRRLDKQPDFNRIWPGTEHKACAETRLMQEVVDVMVKKQLFASIDLHNNTGLNPHYACINKLDPRYLNLANLFSRLVVYFLHPKGVQSAAFAEHCPAVTLECGKPGQQYGVEHACEFVDACLHMTEHSTGELNKNDIDLFHTVAQIQVRETVDFTFNNDAAELSLNADLDHMNFTEIAAETVWGTIRKNSQIPLLAINEEGKDVTQNYFMIKNQQLLSIKPVMPSMLTLDKKVIRQDCLCYLMERIEKS